MRIFTTLCFLCFISISLSSCSTLPTTFTTENIMKVHQGMSSNEILSFFGKPKNISVSVCGTPPNQWTCTTWEYGEFPYDRASFTFSGEHDSLKLNNFKIKWKNRTSLFTNRFWKNSLFWTNNSWPELFRKKTKNMCSSSSNSFKSRST